MTETRTNGRAPKSEARDKPSVKLEVVTPAMAERWLTFNNKNRKLRMKRVSALAGSMGRESEWMLTTDGIGFDWNGNLLNGQHRLHAVLTSGEAILVGVFRGLDPESQNVMDQNLPRRLGDALEIAGESYASMLAASLIWIQRLEYAETTGSPFYASPETQRATVPQLMERFHQDRDELVEMPHLVRQVRKEVPIHPGAFLAGWFRLRRIDFEQADAFVEQFTSGERLTRENPIYQLRRTIIQTRDRAPGEMTMPDYRELALVFKAWNYVREQKPVGKLSWNYGKKVKERFPVPV